MVDRLNITRRDFMNGVSLSLVAGTTMSPLEALAKLSASPAYYPPLLTGLRGSHTGSFEVSHSVARFGANIDVTTEQTDATYDLVVVGGGISGLATAYLFLKEAGPSARVLVLDNHDDFGGHAKRNEFDVDGKKLIGYGGSQSLESPSSYSRLARELLKELAVETDPFYEYFDREYFSRRGSKPGIYFSSEKYGKDQTLDNVFGNILGEADKDTLESVVATYPVSQESKQSILQLLTSDKDYLAGMTVDEKMRHMRSISYVNFLRDHVGTTEEVVLLIRDMTKSYWGFGWDALSALEAYRLDQPGTYNLGLGYDRADLFTGEEPYIFHFPDGNASIARSLVRKLIPGALPGKTMEDLVTSVVDYSLLDQDSANCRIRLNSTAINVQHSADQKMVDVSYVRDGKVERVRGKHVVLACYNQMIPSICPELPTEQQEAIAYAQKTPLVYVNIAVRNWRALAELGYNYIYEPQAPLMHSFGMDFPVSMGDYQYTNGPDQPAILHGTFCPTSPGQGLNQKQQNVAGMQRLYEMSFDEYEKQILRQLNGSLEKGGFDAERDIAAITVNRWPHGYAYEYNDLYDPPEFGPERGPHILGRKQIGRISIANSDSSAYAYVNGAIDAAGRAVAEQIETTG
jgi:spermidine dehydrogenase